MMDMSDVKKLNDLMVKKYKNKKNKIKYCIRLFGNLPNPISIKKFDSEFYDEDMFDDYLRGRVKNVQKFEQLFSIEITYSKIF